MTTVSVKLRRNLDHLTRSLLLKPSSVESNKPSDISLTSFEVKVRCCRLQAGCYCPLKQRNDFKFTCVGLYEMDV